MKVYRLNGFTALFGLIVFLVVLFLVINFIIIILPVLLILGILAYIFRRNLFKWVFKPKKRKNNVKIDRETIDADFKIKK